MDESLEKIATLAAVKNLLYLQGFTDGKNGNLNIHKTYLISQDTLQELQMHPK